MIKLKFKESYPNFIEDLKNLFTNDRGTFVLDEDGDLTHKGYESDSDSSGAIYRYKDDYHTKAWMKLYAIDDKNIYIGIIGQRGVRMTKSVYSWYHTELCRIILNFFDNKLESMEITPNKVSDYDKFGD